MLRQWAKALDLKMGIGIVVVMVLLGVLGYSFGQLGAVGDNPAPQETPTLVAIVSPGTGHAAEGGTPVLIEVLAAGPENIVALDLLVDGTLYGTQPGPSQAGVSPFKGAFAWLAGEPGPHTLVARSHATDGSTANSDPTVVLVTDPGYEVIAEFFPAAVGGGEGEPPSAQEIAQLPTPPPTQVSPPGPGVPVEQGQPWNGGIFELFPWIFGSTSVPDAPELAEPIDVCDVILSIHDLSDNELAFRVYRTDFGETDPGEPLLVIGSTGDSGWVEVLDTVAYGSIHTYTAEAFNSFGSSDPSNPVTVDTAAAGCPPPDPVELFTLFPVALVAPQPILDPYCYAQVGDGWKRSPETGFLELGIAPVDLAALGSAILTLGADPTAQPSTWNCWGWVGGASDGGGTLVPVGEFATPDQLSSDVYQLGGAEDLGTLTLEYGMVDLSASLEAAEPLFGAFDPVSTDSQMVGPALGYTTNTSECINRLPGSIKPDFRLAMCHPDGVDILNPGDLAVHPHSYLVWDLNDLTNCLGGENCVHPSEMTFFPYSVIDAGFRLYDLHQSQTVPIKTFSGFDHDLHIVLPSGECGTTRVFELRSFVKTDQPMTSESQTPTGVRGFVEPCRTDDPVKMYVEFTTLTVGDIDDGIDDDDLEIYGGLRAAATIGGSSAVGVAYYRAAAAGGIATQSFSGCIGEGIFNLLQDDFGWGCPITLTAKTIQWRNWKLAGYNPDTLLVDLPQRGLNQNFAPVTTVEGNNSIQVTIDLWDRDDFTDDPVCVGSIWITKEAGQTWSEKSGAHWNFHQSDNGNASCIVTGRLWVVGQ